MDMKIKKGIERGKSKLEQAELARQKEEAARLNELSNTWRSLEEEWRNALPEEMRPFLRIVESEYIARERSPEDITVRDLFIDIPGLAPIVTSVVKCCSGQWRQERINRSGCKLNNYLVPEAFNDYEFGVMWDYKSHITTDDLDIALAWAEEQRKRYDDILTAEIAKGTEPIYTSIEPADLPFGLTDHDVKQIKNFIIEVVSELKPA